MTFLTREERLKFADWCEENAVSNDGLARQMEAMKSDPVIAKIAERYSAESAALRFIADRLRKTEDVTVGR